jgi:hypothetical protein
MPVIHCAVRPLLALCALSGVMFVTRCASAAGVPPTEATAEQKQAAIDHFRTGKEAIESKTWDRAVSEFRASLALVESPNARLELARALRDSDDLGDAWDEYGRAIESATKLLAREARYARTAEAATAERHELEMKLAFVAVTLAGAPEGATLKVGGRVVAFDQRTRVAAPAGVVDVLLADSAGRELARQTVNALVGQTTQVALDANQVTAQSVAASRGRQPIDASEDERPNGGDQTLLKNDFAVSSRTKLLPLAYIAAGIGVAGLATFGTFGVMSNSTYGDLKSACPSSTGGCPPGKQGEISTGRTEQTVANVGLVVGLLGAAVSVTLFVLTVPSKSSAVSAALCFGPEYLGLNGTL